MTATRNKEHRFGDVVEIPVEGGLAYFQFTHEHKVPPRYGSLIQVLPGIHLVRPVDIAALVRESPVFCVFVHLASLVKQPGVSIVGHFEIPAERQQFPIMKSGNAFPWTAEKILCWWLFDGSEVWPVGVLPPMNASASKKRTVNLPFLQEMISKGYRPVDDVEKFGAGLPLSEKAKVHYADVIRRHNPELLNE